MPPDVFPRNPVPHHDLANIAKTGLAKDTSPFRVMERNPIDDIGAVQDLLMVVSDGVIVLDRTAY